MKNVVKILISLSFVGVGTHAYASPIEISCGDQEQGPAVKIEVSPLKGEVRYAITVKNRSPEPGSTLDPVTFAPTEGIYDTSALSFSSYPNRGWFKVHGSYAQIVRLNIYRAISFELKKDSNPEIYRLVAFSVGEKRMSTPIAEGQIVPELSYDDLVGLACTLKGTI